MRRIAIVLAAAVAAVAAAASMTARAGAVTVSMPTLNVYFGQIDVDDSGDSGGLMRIERGYNSTTTFSGLFGYGWGSWQDQNLAMRPDGKIQFTVFGGGSTTVLESTRDEAAPDPMPQLIDAAQQAQMVGSDDENQRYRVMMGKQDTDAQNQYEAFLKTGVLSPPNVELGEMYRGQAVGMTWSRVVRVPEGYQVTKIADPACSACENFAGIFNARGKLLRSWLPGKPHQFVAYEYDDNDRLVAMQDYDRKRYAFTYDADGHVTKIDAGAQRQAVYTYKSYPDATADLISSRSVTGRLLQYKYDDNDDLTEVTYTDKRTLRATYPGGDGSVGTLDVPGRDEVRFERSSTAKPTVTMTTTSPAGAVTTARFDPDHYKQQTLCT